MHLMLSLLCEYGTHSTMLVMDWWLRAKPEYREDVYLVINP